MKLVVTACLLAGLGWHDWVRLGEEGDKASDPAAAEAQYRKAIALGASLRTVPDVDPHLSRLVASLAAQGKCETPNDAGPALAGMLALARADATTAATELQRASESAPTSGCRATVTDEVLALLRWAEGNEPAALALRKRALGARCKALAADPLDDAAIALNGAWKAGTEKRWAAALATAQSRLGPHHPLIAIALERRAALLDGAGGAQRQRDKAGDVRRNLYCTPPP